MLVYGERSCLYPRTHSYWESRSLSLSSILLPLYDDDRPLAAAKERSFSRWPWEDKKNCRARSGPFLSVHYGNLLIQLKNKAAFMTFELPFLLVRGINWTRLGPGGTRDLKDPQQLAIFFVWSYNTALYSVSSYFLRWTKGRYN